MKKMMSIIVAMAAVLLVSGNAMAAVTLDLVNKGNGVVDVVASDTGNLYGVAFTVGYNSAHVNKPTVESAYFATFSDMDADDVGYPGIVEGSDGLSGGMVSGYDAPVVENVATGTGLRLAAAAAKATAGTNVTIFTLTFTPVTAPISTTITLIPTTITNAAAGYATATQIDPAVGMSGTSFTVEEDVATLQTDAPKVTITLDPPDIVGDLDGNGNIDIFELISIIAHYNSDTGLTPQQLSTVDTDHNGDISIFELLDVIAAYNA